MISFIPDMNDQKILPKLQPLAKWYKGLSPEDKANADLLINEVSEKTIFGGLCVIDGVRSIENSEEKGTFELYYTKNNIKELINTPEGEYLHDLLD